MFNKFKIGETVLCCGFGKKSQKYINRKGIVIEKDYYYKDYCVVFNDKTEEWFEERDIIKIN